jgi:BON domain-containing protein
MRMRTFVLGGAIGAAIVYFFDPDTGRGRRARFRDRALARMRDVQRRADGRTRDALNRAQGRVAEMASTGPEMRSLDDVTLADRIQSTVFGSPDVPNDRINIEVVGGVVRLRGELDSREEIDDISSRIAAVAGVNDVEVLVHLPGQPAPNKEPAVEASRKAQSSARGTASSSQTTAAGPTGPPVSPRGTDAAGAGPSDAA